MATASLHGVRLVHTDGTAALRHVDLTLNDGELMGIIGPSGSGKSTLLRVIAGVDPITDGLIRIADHDVTLARPRDRGVAWVSDEVSLRAALADLDPDLTASPEVATSRHSVRPRQRRRLLPANLLLADDPFRRADPPTQRWLRQALRRAVTDRGQTTLLAANDHALVVAIADRIAVLDRGRLLQVDVPSELLGRPRNRWVAGFVGPSPMSFLPARVHDDAGLGWLVLGTQRLRVPGGLPGPLRSLLGRTVDIGARPEDLRMPQPGDRADHRLTGVVRESVHTGAADRVVIELPGGTWTARFAAGSAPARGRLAQVTVDARRLSAFDHDTGAAIWHGT